MSGLIWLGAIIAFAIYIWKTADVGIPSDIWKKGGTAKISVRKPPASGSEDIGLFVFMHNEFIDDRGGED